MIFNRGGHQNWILDWSRRDSQEWIFIMQELQNWFRILCHSNGVLSPTLPTQPTYRLGYRLAGPVCELKPVRGTKNPKPVLKFLHNEYSFLRVSPWSVKNSILVPAPTSRDLWGIFRDLEEPLRDLVGTSKGPCGTFEGPLRDSWGTLEGFLRDPWGTLEGTFEKGEKTLMPQLIENPKFHNN